MARAVSWALFVCAALGAAEPLGRHLRGDGNQLIPITTRNIMQSMRDGDNHVVLFYQHGAADAQRVLALLARVASKFAYTGIAFDQLACADPIACGEAISVASGTQPDATTPQLWLFRRVSEGRTRMERAVRYSGPFDSTYMEQWIWKAGTHKVFRQTALQPPPTPPQQQRQQQETWQQRREQQIAFANKSGKQQQQENPQETYQQRRQQQINRGSHDTRENAARFGASNSRHGQTQTSGAGFTDAFFMFIGVAILFAGVKQAYSVKDISIDGAGGYHDRSQYSTVGMTRMGIGS